MKYFVTINQKNQKLCYVFTKTNDDFKIKLNKDFSKSDLTELEQIIVDSSAILNPNWYTFLHNDLNFDIKLYATIKDRIQLDVSYIIYASVLIAIKNTKDSLMVAEFFNRNHSVLLCAPLCTKKIIESIAVEALFGWLYGRFCDSSLFESYYYNHEFSANQKKALFSDTSVFLYKAAYSRLSPTPKTETPEQMFIRYFKAHQNTKLSIGIVGSNYANWISSGLDYIEKTIKQSSATDFIAHKTRIQQARNSFFEKTTAQFFAEPYNEHDNNALGLYLDDIESFVTGDSGMCLAGYLRKTGAKVLRESRPNKFVFNSKLIRIGSLQSGKTGLVVEICL